LAWDSLACAATNVGSVAVTPDTVSRLGEMFGDIVSKTLGSGIRIVHNKSGFTEQLRADRSDLVPSQIVLE
jgi:hypothetical protein